MKQSIPARLVHSDSRNQTDIFLKFASRSQTFIVSNTKRKTARGNQQNRNYLSNYLIPVFMLVIAATAVNFVRAEETFQLKVVTDRENAIYETGQSATFLVTLTKGNKPVTAGEVSYIVDDFITAFPPPNNYPKGKLKIGDESKISVSLKQPGFLRCRVSYRTPENKLIRATAGAGFSPLEIKPSLPVPDDFD